MLSRTSLLVLLLASLLTALPSQAQEARVGLGVGISPSSLNVVDVDRLLAPLSIYLPVVTPSFRLEPEIGLLRGSSSDDDFESTSTAFSMGAGLFLNRPMDASTLLYGGVRLGTLFLSDTIESEFGDEDESRTDFFVGPSAGGEHFFSDHFSLGGEAQVLYTSFGDEEDEGEDASRSVLRTRALFFVRWYF
jgi:hypothetical protein